jgi:hypothetical protein
MLPTYRSNYAFGFTTYKIEQSWSNEQNPKKEMVLEEEQKEKNWRRNKKEKEKKQKTLLT